jgi:DNA-binding LacI/PurR family transcriptional regulator
MITQQKRSKEMDRVGELYHELRKLAHAGGPRTQLPTMQELRETYGVSQATISGALDRLEAHNIVTRKDRHGIFVSPNLNRKHIRVLMDASQIDGQLQSPFWGMLWALFVKEAQDRAAHMDEEIRFHLVNPQLYDREIPLPDDITRQLDAGLVHGVICTGMSAPDNKAFEDSDRGLPLVAFAGSGYWQVVMSHARMYDQLVPELVTRGCRKIAYWHATPDKEMFFEEANIEHARQVVAAHGLSLSGDYIRKVDTNDKVLSPHTQGYELAMATFENGALPRPDGILIGDDMITAGALAAMHRLGIVPGRDVMIGTHSNRGSTILRGYEDLLIRSEFDPLEIVRAMFAKLDRLMAGIRPEQQFTYVHPRLQM